MSEMALTAEHLIVIGRGELIADMPTEDFVRRAGKQTVRVRSPAADTLAGLVSSPDVAVTAVSPGLIEISGLSAAQIGDEAAANGIALHELTPLQATLEEAFMELTQDAVEFQAGVPALTGTGRGAAS
jgi:ABC-2 type transport system ATP-binding protein